MSLNFPLPQSLWIRKLFLILFSIPVWLVFREGGRVGGREGRDRKRERERDRERLASLFKMQLSSGSVIPRITIWFNYHIHNPLKSIKLMVVLIQNVNKSNLILYSIEHITLEVVAEAGILLKSYCSYWYYHYPYFVRKLILEVTQGSNPGYLIRIFFFLNEHKIAIGKSCMYQLSDSWALDACLVG